jgi:predicted CopG family antitoxin
MEELDDNSRPASWMEELSELITRKRAEIELLKKVQGSIDRKEAEYNDSTQSGVEIRNDKKEQQSQY